MTAVRITDSALEVSFVRWERVFGLVRDVSVPLSAITEVTAIADGYAATVGMRAPGLGIPGRRKLGTWRSRGSRQLVSVSAGKPAISVKLSGQPFNELLIGADDADALAAGIDRARR